MRLGRRELLWASGALLACGPDGLRAPTVEVPGPKWLQSPFAFGVASGDATPDSVLLWTRLDVPSSMQEASLPVGFELADDALFHTVRQRGVVQAAREEGFSVHLPVEGLPPNAWFHFRFVVQGQVSAIGRTRTLPAAGALVDAFTVGSGCCQSFRAGHFGAQGHAALEGLDAFFFLGDAIYEKNGDGVRQHDSPEPTDLEGYRARHGQYRRDAQLQALHAACPWFPIWDDHEVVNDYGGLFTQSPAAAVDFAQRRKAAYQAYWEFMPLRQRPDSEGGLQLYRDFAVGQLLDVQLLDTRQYRSRLVCNSQTAVLCDDWGRSDDSLLGDAQRAWWFERLRASKAKWNLTAQQVVFSNLIVGNYANADQWDGFPVERAQALEVLRGRSARNAVIFSGDIHLGALTRVLPEGGDAALAVEVVANSFTSGGSKGSGSDALIAGLVGNQPGLLYAYEKQRGYCVSRITEAGWTVDFKVVDTVDVPECALATHARFEVAQNLSVRRATLGG